MVYQFQKAHPQHVQRETHRNQRRASAYNTTTSVNHAKAAKCRVLYNMNTGAHRPRRLGRCDRVPCPGNGHFLHIGSKRDPGSVARSSAIGRDDAGDKLTGGRPYRAHGRETDWLEVESRSAYCSRLACVPREAFERGDGYAGVGGGGNAANRLVRCSG